MNKIRVGIICQQPLFRSGIEHSISITGEVEILQSDELQNDPVAGLCAEMPDVIIVDIDDSFDEHFKLVQKIKLHLPNIGTIVMSNSNDDENIFLALKSQAAAYLTKKATTEELVNTIKRVASGEYPINETFINRPKVASQVVEQFQGLTLYNDEGDFMSPLTTREIEVLDHVARGCPNKQIADKLDISEQTIKNHITSVLRKLNANSRTEAVVQAIRQGIISVA
jgi:DNA-binding NarL/FixJ family response regulator